MPTNNVGKRLGGRKAGLKNYNGELRLNIIGVFIPPLHTPAPNCRSAVLPALRSQDINSRDHISLN